MSFFRLSDKTEVRNVRIQKQAAHAGYVNHEVDEITIAKVAVWTAPVEFR